MILYCLRQTIADAEVLDVIDGDWLLTAGTMACCWRQIDARLRQSLRTESGLNDDEAVAAADAGSSQPPRR